MTKAELIEHIRQRITEAGTQKQLAADICVSESYIVDILKGRRDPSDNFLAKLGFKKVVTYQPK